MKPPNTAFGRVPGRIRDPINIARGIPVIPIEDNILSLGKLEFEFDRSELLVRMKANRDKHSLQFKQALVGYYLEVAEQAKEIAANARKLSKEAEEASKSDDPNKVDKTNWYITATKPEDHTTDYDRVIDMFEMAKQETINLDERQFAQYIRDEWEWKDRVFATNSFYSGKFGRQIEAVTGSSLEL